MFDWIRFSWELKDPWFLLLSILVPLSYMLYGQSKATLQYSSISLFHHLPKSLRLRMLKVPSILLALGLASLILALARPRTPDHESRVSRDGIAMMMVVDLSSSMNARDLVKEDRSINRLDVVKEVFLAFVFGNQGKIFGDDQHSSGTNYLATAKEAGQGRPNDLIGLVTFARYADSICPLTLDHGNLAEVVMQLKIVSQPEEDGTAVGDGLGLAVERLRRSQAKSRIAILLTDGVTNAGTLSPIRAAQLAAENDIKVYCIGAGTNGMAPVPARDLFGRATLVAQPVEIDEASLKQVAEKSGGKYFRAVNREALANIYQEIDTLERTEVSEIRYLHYTEHFGYFVLAGMGLIAAASLLNGSVFRKLP